MKTFGAKRSEYDKRTKIHQPSVKGTPLTTGGTIYQPQDIENQLKVGICTAIDMTNQAGKKYGKKYDADFFYLLEKRFIDGNWDEGSSVLSAMKTGNKYGFLPLGLFSVTEVDRTDYPSYVAKLQAIPIATVYSLLNQCENKLAGYAQLPATDVQTIANAIEQEPTGIQCMYQVDSAWWTALDGTETYSPALIDPIRPPISIIDGHSIKATYFDFTVSKWLLHCNTWGQTYDLQGNCHVGYSPLEAWIPYFAVVPPTSVPFQFTKNLSYGMTDPDIVHLQARLNMPLKYQTGYYGILTAGYVLAYQIAHGILPTAEFNVGPKTRASLNAG